MNQQVQQAQQMPFLFYSKSCQYSQKLINLMKSNPAIMNNMRFVEYEKEQNLPPNLETVPAIFFDGKLFQGNDAFGWVDFQSKRMAGGSQQTQQVQTQNVHAANNPNAHAQQPNGRQLPNAQSNAANAMRGGGRGAGGLNQNPLEHGLPSSGAGASLNQIGDKFNGTLNSTESGDGFMSLQEFGEKGQSGSGGGQMRSMDPSRNAQNSNRPTQDDFTKKMDEMQNSRNSDVQGQQRRGNIPGQGPMMR